MNGVKREIEVKRMIKVDSVGYLPITCSPLCRGRVVIERAYL